MKRRQKPSVESGLTLIELMVTILLAGILTAGLFYMTTGQTRTYRAQLNRASTQERAWGALEYLARQVRMAGFGLAGCPGGVALKHQSGAPAGPGTPPFPPANTAKSLIVGLSVYNDCSLYDFSGTFPPTSGTCNGDGIDSLSVAYVQSSVTGDLASVRVTKAKNNNSADLEVSSCDGIFQNDFVILWDPSDATKWCSVLQITNVPDTTKKKSCKLKHQANAYNPPSHGDHLPPDAKAVGALVMKYGVDEEPLEFAIDATSDPNVPRLVQWRLPSKSDLEVIADGIEDMQITWACERTGDNPVVLSEGRNPTDKGDNTIDDWANNTPSDSFNPCDPHPVTGFPRMPSAVRVTLIARTLSPEPGFASGFRPAAEDHAPGAPDKGTISGPGSYGRTVVTTTIRPRNIREQN